MKKRNLRKLIFVKASTKMKCGFIETEMCGVYEMI